ncbi:MAG: diguanylate cyclase [Bacteroidetes bacterium]|nr:diguanylate cyclase [Bacteroidota bacterium]
MNLATVRIHIIESDEDFADNVKQSLLKQDQYDVTISTTGKEGVERAFNELPDVIIVATSLPDTDGYNVLDLLKSAQTTHEIPILLVSNSAPSTEKIVHGLEMGAVDFVIRPIHTAEFCARVKVAIRNYRIQKSLREKAVTDTLTGLYNRSILEYRMQTELKRSQRHGIPISGVMVDIDHFKKINDTFGHLFGDQVLKTLGEILLRRARTDDIIVRYGGEEFLLLLFGADSQGAYAFAERVRIDFQSKIFYVNGQTVHFTLSAGVAQYSASMTPTQFIDTADKALYLAKNSGRNRVISAKQEDIEESLPQ